MLASVPRPISVAVRNRDVVSRRLGGSSILVNLTTNSIFELNDTAARVWELLSFTQTVPALAAELQKEFDVERQGATRQVEALLRQLESQGLVRLQS